MLIDFWNTIKPWLDGLGYLTTIIVIVTTIAGVLVWIKGLLPALIRLGLGFSRRKIVVFATGDEFNALKSLLIDSKLFSEKNIQQVQNTQNLGRAEGVTLFLVFWPDWKNNISKIIEKKLDGTGMVVYAPYDSTNKIPNETMKELDKHRNVTVTNFRGRLLNDIVVTMITTDHKVK